MQEIKDLSKAILWNNKFICIEGKSVYFKALAEKGILRMRDLISENNELILKGNCKLRELNISPLDVFRLVILIDDLPVEWRELRSMSVIRVFNYSKVTNHRGMMV